MEKTRINIVSGFLGSGKTTLIKKILEEKRDTPASLYKTVVIENEFGDVSIDSLLLKDSEITIREINSGCICCSVAGDFEESLKEIRSKFKPEEIIIEPTGVGRLSDIISTCKRYSEQFYINTVITVVNPILFEMYLKNFGEFYTNQISSSEIVIFSRYKQAQETGVDFLYLEEKIKKLNKNIIVLIEDWDKIVISPYLDKTKKTVDTSKKRFRKANSFLNKTDNPQFETITLDISQKFSVDDLRDILQKINKDRSFGDILRAKGFVGMDKDLDYIEEKKSEDSIFFDLVPDEISIKKTKFDGDKKIVIIGKNLDVDNIYKLFSMR